MPLVTGHFSFVIEPGLYAQTRIMQFEVKDIRLADKGQARIDWARNSMGVLDLIRKRFARERALEGVRISACLHVTTETANLVLALKEGGAQVVLCGSNPLSTQDDVAAALVRFHEVSVFAMTGEDTAPYYK